MCRRHAIELIANLWILRLTRNWRRFQRFLPRKHLNGSKFWKPTPGSLPPCNNVRFFKWKMPGVQIAWKWSSMGFQDVVVRWWISCRSPRWRHQMETFSALLALCAGNSPVNSPHKGQWRGALKFSMVCARINGWVNNHEADDLRRHRAHYDVNVMDPGGHSRHIGELGKLSITWMKGRCTENGKG